MKYLGITYGMKRRSGGTEESVESHIELPVSDENFETVSTIGITPMLATTIDRICMLQGYYYEGIKKIEEVTLGG